MNPLTFRPITEDDLPFLRQLYGSTREDEMAMVADWSEAQKTQFLDQQFHAQHTFYMDQFKSAKFELVLIDGKPIGRLYKERRPDEIRLIDIALLSEHRQKGYGRQLMEGVLAEGASLGLPVRIHVERNNPAMRLYDRLGFKNIGDTGVYFLMEWKP